MITDTINILRVVLDKRVTYVDHITEHIWKAFVLPFYSFVVCKK